MGAEVLAANEARMKQAENPLLIDLALQGGGSRGAFTWGVLDRLFEESQLRIEAISGTSAGAMNAAVLADGWTEDGAEGAHLALDKILAARISPLQRSPLDRLMGRWTLDTSIPNQRGNPMVERHATAAVVSGVLVCGIPPLALMFARPVRID
jgi:predicted acylesterase/phospholipase RssA